MIARKTIEQLGHMILTIPSSQMIQIVSNGIETGNFRRVDIFHNVSLRTGSVADVLAFGLKDDTVQYQLSQWKERRFRTVSWLGSKFHLPVQHIAAQEVVVI